VADALKPQLASLVPPPQPARATPELVAAVARALQPPPPPPKDPLLISQGRVFNTTSVVVSSFDEEDVTNRSITRSSFDDTATVNHHPTGP
jgi:hypothetical protein